MKKQWHYLNNNGSTINGIDITPSGLLAGAHLVGNGGVGRYTSSNGRIIPTDRNGTSIEKYFNKFRFWYKRRYSTCRLL